MWVRSLMAKEKKGSGIQQAAGLIRYFDEESEDAIQISKGTIYFACISFSVVIYLAQHGVWSWMYRAFGI
ncbi:MAG: preprotein translocase subunit Sec61beta [Euryarchaeota archaeon]|nr:preprotein translocase subunit Sec61beta [Euryarchaeota archaeon]